MKENSINILSTRTLAPEQVHLARQQGIFIDVLPFIETEPLLQSVEVQQEISQALLLTATVIFTSVNAVEAVAFYLDPLDRPDWGIYCTGHKTRELVEKYFGKGSVLGSAPSAAALAELIIDQHAADGAVLFFCGDQRREELPQMLLAQGIEIDEIVVYHTIATPHKIEKHYHGILFFSPSAVDSFFVKNKAEQQTVLFAIGTTTAAYIKKYTTNKVIISKEPVKQELIDEAIQFFAGK